MELTIDRFKLSKSGKELNDMKHGDSIFIPESDYGLGYICKSDTEYEFWEIPMYGGVPYFSERFSVSEDGARECVKYIQSIS